MPSSAKSYNLSPVNKIRKWDEGVILTASTGESYSTPPPSFYHFPMVREFLLYIKATAKVKSEASLASIFKLLDFKTGWGELLEELGRLLGNKGKVRVVFKVDKMYPVRGGVGRSPLEVIHQRPRHLTFHFNAVISDRFQHLISISAINPKMCNK